MQKLPATGWKVVRTNLPDGILATLRESVFAKQNPGQRCLLDHPLVRQIAASLRSELIEAGFLEAGAVAIQAIGFDKTSASNWKVTWHQDVMFPLAKRATKPGYDLVSVKDGVDYARPPRTVLEEMLAVRLHLDDCDDTNGPLRVAPHTHLNGVFKSADLCDIVERHGEATCSARTGEILLMKPLLLHASSPATAPGHRRVLHLVYHSGHPPPEIWHRAV